MKRFCGAAVAGLVLFVAVLLGGCPKQTTVNPPANPPANGDWTITATWNFDFTNFVPCSATVAKGCIQSFTWGYLTGTVQVPLKTSAASVCSGTTQPEACTDTVNGTVGMGAVTFFCEANYVDNSGNAGVTSQDESSPVNVATGSPTNLAVSLK